MTSALTIRDAIFVRVTDGDTYKTKRKGPGQTLTPADLPAIVVVILTGIGTPDGDDNAGPIAFVNDDTIGISIARGFDDRAVLEGTLDAEIDAIKSKLFTDPTFVRFFGQGPDVLFEAITRVVRRWIFPSQGEANFAELRLEITFKTREDFKPDVPDDYQGLNVNARPIANPDAPLIERRIEQEDN